MSAMYIQTKNLKLVPYAPEELRALIAAMDPSEKAELSPDWLACDSRAAT